MKKKTDKSMLLRRSILLAMSLTATQIHALEPEEAEPPIPEPVKYFENLSTHIGSNVVLIDGTSHYQRVSKGDDSSAFDSDFFKIANPFSPDEVKVGSVDQYPYIQYNEMNGALTATLPAINLNDITLTPSYFAPTRNRNSIERFDSQAGTTGVLGVGWHLGLGHLAVQRRPYGLYKKDDQNETVCKWQSAGWEKINYVDGSGRSSAFAEQYFTVADEHIGRTEYPGEAENFVTDRGHIYLSSGREQDFVDSSGRILTRKELVVGSGEQHWDTEPAAEDCNGITPTHGNHRNEAKITQNADGTTLREEYGWFHFDLASPDGSKVRFTATADSIAQANTVASEKPWDKAEPVMFYPTRIIQPNGVTYHLYYRPSNANCDAYGEFCVGSRYVSRIERVDGNESSELYFYYAEQDGDDLLLTSIKSRNIGAGPLANTSQAGVDMSITPDPISTKSDDAMSTLVARFDYQVSSIDNKKHLSAFTDAVGRVVNIEVETDMVSGPRSSTHPWIKSITSPAGGSVSIDYELLTDIPIGAYFPRGCSTWDWGTGQWFWDVDFSTVEDYDVQCDPAIYGGDDVTVKRIKTVNHSDLTVTYDYKHRDLAGGDGIEDKSSYQYFDNSVQADALWQVTKTAGSADTELYQRETFYAAYDKIYANLSPGLLIGKIAGKPVFRTTYYRNSELTGHYTDTIEEEWIWQPRDQKIGGNPDVKHITAPAVLDKHAVRAYSSTASNEPSAITYTANYYDLNQLHFGNNATVDNSVRAKRLAHVFAKPNKIERYNLLYSDYQQDVRNPALRQIQEFDYIHHFDKMNGDNDTTMNWSYYQFGLVDELTACFTRGTDCSANANLEQIISMQNIDYQLKFAPLPNVSTHDFAGNLTAVLQQASIDDDRSSSSNKISKSLTYHQTGSGLGLLASESIGGLTRYFDDYKRGSAQLITAVDGSTTVLDTQHIGDDLQITSFNRGITSVSRSDAIGRELFNQVADTYATTMRYPSELVVQHFRESEIASAGKVLTNQSTLDIWGRVTEQVDAIDYGITATSSAGYSPLGFENSQTNSEGGVTRIHSDITGRPMKKQLFDSSGTLVKTIDFAYDIEKAANGSLLKVDTVSNVIATSGDHLSISNKVLVSKKDELQRMVYAKSCESKAAVADANCTGAHVEIDYNLVDIPAEAGFSSYDNVTQQRVKVMANGAMQSERHRYFDLLQRLVKEYNPEIGSNDAVTQEYRGITRYSYNSAGQQDKVTNIGGNYDNTIVYDKGRVDRVSNGNTLLLDYEYDSNNYGLVTGITVPLGQSGNRAVIENYDYDSNNRLETKEIIIPQALPMIDNLRPLYVDEAPQNLVLRWQHSADADSTVVRFTHLGGGNSAPFGTVLLTPTSSGELDLTHANLLALLQAELANPSGEQPSDVNLQAWINHLTTHPQSPVDLNHRYEWSVEAYTQDYEPIPAPINRQITNACQILDFGSVKGSQQGPLLYWQTRNCEGLSVRLLASTADDLPDAQCVMKNGIMSGYKQGPQRAHFMYNGYNYEDVINAQNGDSSVPPVFVEQKDCPPLNEAYFRLSIVDHTGNEVLGTKSLTAGWDNSTGQCEIRNFSVNQGYIENGEQKAPTVFWETTNCEGNHVELTMDVLDTNIPAECDISGQALSTLASGQLEVNEMLMPADGCSAIDVGLFNLTVHQSFEPSSAILDKRGPIAGYLDPQSELGCHIASFNKIDGSDTQLPRISWKTSGCGHEQVKVKYNAVQPGVTENCQLRDITFSTIENGDTQASFMFTPYTVANNQPVAADVANSCGAMKSADVWIEIYNQAGDTLVQDTPPLDISYSGDLISNEPACSIGNFTVADSNTLNQLPNISWTTSCGNDVSVQVHAEVPTDGTTDAANCSFDYMLWDGHKSGSRSPNFMAGGYGTSSNCPPVSKANFKLMLIDAVSAEVIEESAPQQANFNWNADFFAGRCDIDSFTVQNSTGFIPLVNYETSNGNSACYNEVKLKFSSTDPLLPSHCVVSDETIMTYRRGQNIGLHLMKEKTDCPAIEKGVVWLEQYNNSGELLSHTSFKDVTYSSQDACSIGSFDVINPNATGQLPTVKWETNCNNRVSVRVRTTTHNFGVEQKCRVIDAIWDGNKSLSAGRTVDYMAGGWGATDASPSRCDAVTSADFYVQLFDEVANVELARSEVKTARYIPYNPAVCEIDIFNVINTDGQLPVYDLITSCYQTNNDGDPSNDVDAVAEVWFEGVDKLGNTITQRVGTGLNAGGALNIMAEKEIESGWIWTMLYDSSYANRNLIHRSSYKSVVYNPPATTSNLTAKSDENPIETNK